MVETADVVVVGMGPGGEDVAGRLAEQGLAVVGIDQALLGGECPYWGCVPSKMALRAALALAEGRRIAGLAGRADVFPDWEPVARRIRDVATDNWNDQVAVDRFEAKGGRFLRGHARLDGPRRVVVGDTTIEARRGVVLNTGSEPVVPPIPGLDRAPYWTNHEILEAAELPASLIVLGGGAIGAELSQAVARFGVAVTIVEAMATLVPIEEPEAGAALAAVFRAEGIDVRTGVKAQRVSYDSGKFTVALSDGHEVTAEKLLVAVGRRPRTKDIGLASVGIDEDAHPLPVDDKLRLGDGLWAIGDMVGLGAFTHLSMYHAGIVVADICGEAHPPAHIEALPRVTFTDPEIGSVGSTERTAREQGRSVRIGLTETAQEARGWIHGPGGEGVIKLVVDAEPDVLVGATAMGPAGGEVLSMLTLAVHARLPLSTLRTMVYAYPTFHRGIESALAKVH